MPLYEYECQQCHRRTEKIQKYSDPDLTVCPHCGGPLERTITAASIAFKGSGWYKDLYSSAKPAASGEASASNSEDPTVAKSDTAAPSSPNADKPAASNSTSPASATSSTASSPSTASTSAASSTKP